MIDFNRYHQKIAQKDSNQLAEELKQDRDKRIQKWNKALALMKEVENKRKHIESSYSHSNQVLFNNN